jgi:hypothetical protein
MALVVAHQTIQFLYAELCVINFAFEFAMAITAQE